MHECNKPIKENQWNLMKLNELNKFNEPININQWTSMKLNNWMNPSIDINGHPWQSMKWNSSINQLININGNQHNNKIKLLNESIASFSHPLAFYYCIDRSNQRKSMASDDIE